MKNILLILISVSFIGCATAYKKGSPDYIEHQVYQCRKLCSAGTIDIAHIEGLECECNTRQQANSVVNNIIVPGNSGQPVNYITPTYTPAPSANKSEATEELKVKDNAALIQSGDGRNIYSQVR